MTPIVTPKLNYGWTSTVQQSSFEPVTPISTFWPDLEHGFSGEPVDTTFAHLYKELSNRARKGRLQALQCALLNLANACNHTSANQTCGVLLPSTTSTTKQPTRYRVNGFSSNVLTAVLKDMAAVGLVRQRNGFRGEKHERGLGTVWFPDSVFYQWWSKHSEQLSLTVFNESHELLRLNQKRKTGTVLKDYTESERSVTLRQQIELTNEVRLSCSWKVPIKPADETLSAESFSITSGYMPKRVSRTFNDIGFTELTPSDLICHRMFRDDFQTNGRFYCRVQQLSKEERLFITCNDEATVEIDYKSMQLRLLYHLEGLEAPHDCYASTLPRGLVKTIALRCLNCKSRQEAISSVCKHLSADRKEVERCFDIFESEHPTVSQRFYQSLSGQTQYLDSSIALSVMLKAAEEGIAVLPIHDSFRVATRYAFRIAEIAKEAYRETMGFDPVITADGFGELKDCHQDILSLIDQANQDYLSTN